MRLLKGLQTLWWLVLCAGAAGCPPAPFMLLLPGHPALLSTGLPPASCVPAGCLSSHAALLLQVSPCCCGPAMSVPADALAGSSSAPPPPPAAAGTDMVLPLLLLLQLL
jgi:hypothetical protein